MTLTAESLPFGNSESEDSDLSLLLENSSLSEINFTVWINWNKSLYFCKTRWNNRPTEMETMKFLPSSGCSLLSDWPDSCRSEPGSEKATCQKLNKKWATHENSRLALWIWMSQINLENRNHCLRYVNSPSPSVAIWLDSFSIPSAKESTSVSTSLDRLISSHRLSAASVVSFLYGAKSVLARLTRTGDFPLVKRIGDFPLKSCSESWRTSK